MSRFIVCWNHGAWLPLYCSDTDYWGLTQTALTCSPVYGVLMSGLTISVWAKRKAVGCFIYSYLSHLFPFLQHRKKDLQDLLFAELDKCHSFQHVVDLAEGRFTWVEATWFIFINDNFLEKFSPVVWCSSLIYLAIAMLWPMDRKWYQPESRVIQPAIECGEARSFTFVCKCLLISTAAI